MIEQSLTSWARERVPAPPLIGRDRDLERIRQVLADPAARLITITGPGGVGKTRLALAVAAEQAGLAAAPPPVIELASITDSSLILPAIAAALAPNQTATGTLLEVLAQSLGQASGLLLLDNLEHLPGAPAVTAELLGAVPGLRILATSRSRLHLSGETVIELPPLAVPGQDQSLAPESLVGFSAVELFVRRMRDQLPWFTLNPDNAAAVIELCRRLDGMPLAIELVTSRARVLAVPDMLARIEQSHALLSAPRPDAPPRQWTMNASIEWSVGLLPAPAREALARLAIFPGSFDLSSAAAVADVGIDLLEMLIEHHLVRLVEQASASHRFALLDSIKQFSLERLLPPEEERAQRDRHAAWVADLIEALEPGVMSPEWDANQRRFRAHLDDLYAALSWAIERADPVTAARVFAAARLYWSTSIPWETSHDWLQRVMAVLDPAALDPLLAARFMTAAGLVAYHAGQLAESDRFFEQAIELARRAANVPVLALAICRHGQTLRGLGESDRADAMMRELRDLAPRITDQAVRFAVYNELGAQGLFHQDLDAAWADLHEALASARALGYPAAEGVVLHFLGYVAALRGELDVARDAFHHACTLQAVGVETQRLSTIHGLGRVEYLARRPAEAARWLGEALDGRHRRGERLQVRLCLIDLGLVMLQIGEVETAVRWFGAADLNERISGPRRFFIEYWIEAAEAARAALGEAAYERAYRRGQLDTLDQAVTAALRHASNLPMSVVLAGQPVPSSDAPAHLLTARELDVLRLLVEGASDREIAETLFISSGTATRHVKNILHKLGVPSRTAAATLAVRRGIIAPGE